MDLACRALSTQGEATWNVSASQSEDESREVQLQMQDESIAKVSRRGWTPEHYVAVGDAINSNRELATKTLALIEGRN
jgi:hypothetical protein